MPVYHHATRATAPGSGIGDPATNVPPTPDYWPTCYANGANSTACIDAVVTAINNARALEGVAPIVLPAGFASQSTAVQTFIVSNLERVDRGLQPAAGLVGSLNTLATSAANADADPMLANWSPIGPFQPDYWGSNWAGDLNPLAADYDWMYNDGWGPTGSYNIDCTSATDTGCWGHRHNVLDSYRGEMLVSGVGSVVQSQWTSIAQIFVAGGPTYPSFTYAWPPGSSQTATPSTSTGTSAPDATSLSATAPTRVVAGRAISVTGRLTDTVAGAGVAGAPVRICSRTVVSTTTSCTTATTDSTGTATATFRPKVTSVFWIVYDGSAVLSSTTSRQVKVGVRPALTLRAAHASTGWKVTAHLSPARGQTVRLQRHTSSGWVTLRRRSARTWMSFTHLRAGTYRLTVGAVTGSLATGGRVRAA